MSPGCDLREQGAVWLVPDVPAGQRELLPGLVPRRNSQCPMPGLAAGFASAGAQGFGAVCMGPDKYVSLVVET